MAHAVPESVAIMVVVRDTTLAAVPANVPRATMPNLVPTLVPTLAGLDRDGLMAALGGVGVPAKQQRMRAAQLSSWLYCRGVTSFEQ